HRGLDLVGLRDASGSHRFVGPPATIPGHAGATQRLCLGKDEPTPKRRGALGKEEGLHAFGADKPRTTKKSSRVTRPFRRRAQVPAMTEMLADRSDERVLPVLADQTGRFLDARAPAHRVGIGVEFVK